MRMKLIEINEQLEKRSMASQQQLPDATVESVDYILIDYLQLIDWEDRATREE